METLELGENGLVFLPGEEKKRPGMLILASLLFQVGGVFSSVHRR